MKFFQLAIILLFALCLTACASKVSTPDEKTFAANPASLSAPLTPAEAKSEACPVSLLEAGANQEDCLCIEAKLYDLGQAPGALAPEGGTPKALFGDGSGIRKIAIGLLRHDAIEQCGLFDPDHVVAKNL